MPKISGCRVRVVHGASDTFVASRRAQVKARYRVDRIDGLHRVRLSGRQSAHRGALSFSLCAKFIHHPSVSSSGPPTRSVRFRPQAAAMSQRRSPPATRVEKRSLRNIRLQLFDHLLIRKMADRQMPAQAAGQLEIE